MKYEDDTHTNKKPQTQSRNRNRWNNGAGIVFVGNSLLQSEEQSVVWGMRNCWCCCRWKVGASLSHSNIRVAQFSGVEHSLLIGRHRTWIRHRNYECESACLSDCVGAQHISTQKECHSLISDKWKNDWKMSHFNLYLKNVFHAAIREGFLFHCWPSFCLVVSVRFQWDKSTCLTGWWKRIVLLNI